MPGSEDNVRRLRTGDANLPPDGSGGGGDGIDLAELEQRLGVLETQVSDLTETIGVMPSDVDILKKKIVGWRGLDGRMWWLLGLCFGGLLFLWNWADGKYDRLDEQYETAYQYQIERMDAHNDSLTSMQLMQKDLRHEVELMRVDNDNKNKALLDKMDELGDLLQQRE